MQTYDASLLEVLYPVQVSCSPLFLVMPALFCAVNRAKRPNINRWIFNNCTSLGVHFLQLFNAHVTLL